MKPRILIALLGALATSGWAPAHAGVVTDWNAITLVCVQGPVPPGAFLPGRGGPPGLLDIALVHAAVHDAVQANQGRFEAYEYENPALRGVGSPEAAAAAAAYGVLVGLYGANHPCLATVTNPAVTYAGDPGLQAGNEAAAALLLLHRPRVRTTVGPLPGRYRPRRVASDSAGKCAGCVPVPDGDRALCAQQEFAVPPAAPAAAVERRLCPPVQRGQELRCSERHGADGGHANAGTDRSRPLLADEPLPRLARDGALHRRGASRGRRRPGPAVCTRQPRLRRRRDHLPGKRSSTTTSGGRRRPSGRATTTATPALRATRTGSPSPCRRRIPTTPPAPTTWPAASCGSWSSISAMSSSFRSRARHRGCW